MRNWSSRPEPESAQGTVGIGVRRQSEAATALWMNLEEIVIGESKAVSRKRRLPSHSKFVALTRTAPLPQRSFAAIEANIAASTMAVPAPIEIKTIFVTGWPWLRSTLATSA